MIQEQEMIKVLMEFENKKEMDKILEKMGMELTVKFHPIKGDDIDYLVQLKQSEQLSQ